jgi:hypothetical protein
VRKRAVHRDTILTDPDDIRMLAAFVTGITIIEL